ncbi:MAG: hypothetical protein WCC81_11205 [Pseudolabrys sp.]
MLALGLSGAVASAQNHVDNADSVALQQNKLAALNELSGEYLECSAYFTVTAYCTVGYPAPRIPKLQRDYRDWAKTALTLAISTGRVLGLTGASVEATSKLVATSQMQSISNDCSNVRDLSERYGAFCKQLLQTTDVRFAELLAGRICAGLFKCALNNNSELVSASSRAAR